MVKVRRGTLAEWQYKEYTVSCDPDDTWIGVTGKLTIDGMENISFNIDDIDEIVWMLQRAKARIGRNDNI